MLWTLIEVSGGRGSRRTLRHERRPGGVGAGGGDRSRAMPWTGPAMCRWCSAATNLRPRKNPDWWLREQFRPAGADRPGSLDHVRDRGLEVVRRPARLDRDIPGPEGCGYACPTMLPSSRRSARNSPQLITASVDGGRYGGEKAQRRKRGRLQQVPGRAGPSTLAGVLALVVAVGPQPRSGSRKPAARKGGQARGQRQRAQSSRPRSKASRGAASAGRRAGVEARDRRRVPRRAAQEPRPAARPGDAHRDRIEEALERPWTRVG